MLAGLLPNLPPLDKSPGGMTFAGKIKPAPQPKKPTVPDMKKVAKLLEGMGKQVTGITVQSDGFTVAAADPAQAEKSGYWDKVLPK